MEIHAEGQKIVIHPSSGWAPPHGQFRHLHSNSFLEVLLGDFIFAQITTSGKISISREKELSEI